MRFRPGGDSDAAKSEKEQNKWVWSVRESEDEASCDIHSADRVTTWHTRTSKHPTSATELLEPLQTR
jgi:hypothetical protein